MQADEGVIEVGAVIDDPAIPFADPFPHVPVAKVGEVKDAGTGADIDILGPGHQEFLDGFSHGCFSSNNIFNGSGRGLPKASSIFGSSSNDTPSFSCE